MERRVFDPLTEADEIALGKRCTICSEKFKVGDVTTYINERPDGPEEAMKHHKGLAHRAIADLVHNVCVERKVEEYRARIQAQRTEILDAFVAKYNCQPDEAAQVNAGNKWMVVRIPEDERKAIRTMMVTIEENAKLMADIKLVVEMIAQHLQEYSAVNPVPLSFTPERREAYDRLHEWLSTPPKQDLTNVIPMTIPKDGKLPTA